MRAQRIWIEIVIIGSVIALALALFLGTVGAAAGWAEGTIAQATSSAAEKPGAASPVRVFEGMVSCSRCGAKHSPALERPATVCVRVCVHGGARFELLTSDSAYLLNGQLQSVKGLAGQRARVAGTLVGNAIEVKSVTAAD
jgi:hypothetical protein